MLALQDEKKSANGFRNKVSRVEHTDTQNDRQTEWQTDRLTLNFVDIDYIFDFYFGKWIIYFVKYYNFDF